MAKHNHTRQSLDRQASTPKLHHDTLPTQITVFEYGVQHACQVQEFANEANIAHALPRHVYRWVDIRGLQDAERVGKVVEAMGLPNEVVARSFHDDDAPKVVESNDYILILIREVYVDTKVELGEQRMLICITKDQVLTIQDDYVDRLEEVRDRIKGEHRSLHKAGPVYLTYVMLQTIVENYYESLDTIDEQVDRLEEQILDHVQRSQLKQLLAIKMQLGDVKSSIAWERLSMMRLRTSHHELLDNTSRELFNNVYQSTMHLVEMVDNQRQALATVMDLYMSGVQVKANEVMKVLTMISSIFLPLSFIAGIYGMNFMEENPYTGEKLPLNMPELRQGFGYIGALSTMVAVAVLMVAYFIRRGWFKKED